MRIIISPFVLLKLIDKKGTILMVKSGFKILHHNMFS